MTTELPKVKPVGPRATRGINAALLHAVDGYAEGGDISEHGVTEKNTSERVSACN